VRSEELGQLALSRGHYQEAVNIFRRALDEKATPIAWWGLGRSFESLGDPLKARWAYSKGLELQPAHEPLRRAQAAIQARIAKPRKPSKKQRLSNFRTKSSIIERKTGGKWTAFHVKGVNLGLGLPGYFPGEYPVEKGTYLDWFRQMSRIGFNTVRIYTIHPPAFYEALAEVNEGGAQISLLQGIWAEFPDDSDLANEKYIRYVHQNIGEAIDVVFGSAAFPERPGLPSGTYTEDISPYLIGYIVGREWESCPVRAFNDSQGRVPCDYDGTHLTIRGGTPFECWIARICDYVCRYSSNGYGVVHPVSTICWPTLDPLVHPSESVYEDGLRWQGQPVETRKCSENEDSESLDLAKIRPKGETSFFASYHAYPYYPDFMNNDYLKERNPYQTYLELLRRHHGDQPIVVAEFGVPSSREVAHWHRLGWHHGGHTEKSQGEIDATMIRTIRDAGLAGGVLFSWFDEWFKRNWLFFDYEVPAVRKPFWFNFQDAEENYGLIGAYPGYPRKIVTLTGNRKEWGDEFILYRKSQPAVFRFDDGGDASRTLRCFSVRHDEGFVYCCLESESAVDFSHANYLIGIDTCAPLVGETVLPFDVGFESPVGLKFLVHLNGKETSRILIAKSYDKYLNVERKAICPVKSNEGAWVILQSRTNERRTSKDGKQFFPPRVFSMSGLVHGTLDPEHPFYNSLADFSVNGRLIEMRIPWGLLQFTDPSSKEVLWRTGNKTTASTDGIRFLACSYKPSGRGLLAEHTASGNGIADLLPASGESQDIRTYTWNAWNVPTFHFYAKSCIPAIASVLGRVR